MRPALHQTSWITSMLLLGKGSLSLCPSSHSLQVKQEGVESESQEKGTRSTLCMIFLLKSVYHNSFTFLWAYLSSSMQSAAILLFTSVEVKSQFLSLVSLVQLSLTPFTEKRDQSGSFSLTCWLRIRDTSEISWIFYFWWHYYYVFIQLVCNIMHYLLFVVIPILPFKFLRQLELEVKPLVLPFLTSKN